MIAYTQLLETLRACSKDEAAFHQLIDLFERHTSEGEYRYRLLADHFPDGIVALVDHDLCFLLVNGQGLAANGLDARAFVGRHLADVFGEAVAARDEPQIRAALQGEARAVEVDYEGHYYFVRTLPVRDQDDQIVAAMVVTQDITERQRLEERRVALLEREQQARWEAERAIATQQLFLGMVSHELRTPLASIKGFASSLLAPDVRFTPDEATEFLQIIDQEADKLTELIEQLLDVVGMQSGTLSVVPVATSVDAIVQRAEPELRTLTVDHSLHLQLASDLPDVMADEKRVAQVIINLVGNAVKFSPPGTDIVLSASAKDGCVQVVVSDQGPGFPPSERETVFDPFYQVIDDAPNKPGSGLGLAICKGLVEAHGGKIWVEDRPGPGATVTFTLPVSGHGHL